MADLTLQDLERGERLRAVTDNLFFWQGLRFVALGPVMILVAFVAANPRIGEPAGTALMALALAAATAASVYFGRRYAVLGEVVGVPGAHRRRSRLKWLLAYPLMFGAMAVDLAYPQPILLTGIIWAGALLAFRRSTGGGRDHYLVLAAALAAFTAAPLLTGRGGVEAIGLLMLVIGTGHAACTWLDDREMRRILGGA
jgi:hypothetical protein